MVAVFPEASVTVSVEKAGSNGPSKVILTSGGESAVVPAPGS